LVDCFDGLFQQNRPRAEIHVVEKISKPEGGNGPAQDSLAVEALEYRAFMHKEFATSCCCRDGHVAMVNDGALTASDTTPAAHRTTRSSTLCSEAATLAAAP
jgi:hypothetical protein